MRVAAAVLGALITAAGCGNNNPSSALDPESDIKACIEERFGAMQIDGVCIDSVLAAFQPAIQSIRNAYEGKSRDETYRALIAGYCSMFITAVDEEVQHSADKIPPYEAERYLTQICLKVAWQVWATGIVSTVAAPSATVDEDYPCGDADGRKVLCASSSAFPAGDHVSLAMVMTAEIPLAEPQRFYQYGFVFDADGDPDNNYRASVEYPNDFFDATDRWYVASYSPQAGWSLQVSDATGGTVTPVSSDARVVIAGQTMLLILPLDELATSCPAYRMTAFSHLGDYGLEPPHVWSGDVEPAVHTPLETTCIELPPLPEPS